MSHGYRPHKCETHHYVRGIVYNYYTRALKPYHIGIDPTSVELTLM